MLAFLYCGATYSNDTSIVYDIFMNFFVVPREFPEINERGAGGRVLQKSRKKKTLPPFILNLRICSLLVIHVFINALSSIQQFRDK